MWVAGRDGLYVYCMRGLNVGFVVWWMVLVGLGNGLVKVKIGCKQCGLERDAGARTVA